MLLSVESDFKPGQFDLNPLILTIDSVPVIKMMMIMIMTIAVIIIIADFFELL